MTEPVVVEAGAGGLERAHVSGPHGTGEVYLQGAHVTGWTPPGAAPVIFLSRRAVYAAGTAIRGGVPVIFPWFGPHAADRTRPMHGFARSRPWRLVATEAAPDGRVTLTLALDDDEATRALWPHAFQARYRVAFGDALDLALEIINPGPAPFTFEAALHTYLAVADVTAVGVHGLDDTVYIDKVDGMARRRHGRGPLRLSGETDRVFLGTRARCVVDDAALHRRLVIDKTGSATTVVWNPWSSKAKDIADLEPDDWRRMLCVETANAADDAVTLPASARHVMTASVRVEPA